MSEKKTFPPTADFSNQAHISSEAALERFCETARQQPEAFWAELSRAIEFKKPSTTNQQLSTLVLGGGSNILFTQNFDGLVLKNEIKGIEVVNEDDEFV